MGKRLLIVCDGKTLHDDEVDEITWTDTADGVSIVGKHIRKSVRPKTTGGKGLLEMLAEGRKQQTARQAEEMKAAALEEDSAVEVLPEPEVIAEQ